MIFIAVLNNIFVFIKKTQLLNFSINLFFVFIFSSFLCFTLFSGSPSHLK